MKKLFYTLFAALLISINTEAQIDISVARGMSEGTEVTVEGIVTNGEELGIIRYLQDDTGGIAAYPGTGSTANFPDNVKRGDMIMVRGPLKYFNELLEIDPIMEYSIISSNNTLPDALLSTPNDINESTESNLLTIENVKIDNGGSSFSVGNYGFTSNGEDGEIYIRSNHPLIGTEIPLAAVNLTGIVSQFNTIYQLLPRDINDIEIVDNFYITSSPVQSSITKTSFTVDWTTNAPGNSILRYGTTMALGQEVIVNDINANHSVDLMNLDPAEFYYVQAVSNNGSSEVSSAIQYYATASESSGETKIYFNHEVDENSSTGAFANGTSSAALEAAILERINNATVSIDIAMYNINRIPIVTALTNAFNRGVDVRYIADNETANLALSNPSPPFTVIRGNSDGLMHNKFLAIDRNSVNDSWLIMGSTNFTEQNMASDYNNTIFIQDQALVKAYTVEFQEMWGSEGQTPGVFNVKFGPDKANNTPHKFVVNDMDVESYFSPSDNTSIQIANQINQAESDISFALLTFTNNELGNAVLNAHNRNIEVRGIIDNINDTGSEYGYLSGQGVNVTADFTTKSTHHKYCIIDTEVPDGGVLISGSHNWSGGADTRNDENTLIFHDDIMANIFKQEFEARWCETQGGSNCITTSLENVTEIEGIDISVFPNPSSSSFNLTIDPQVNSDIVVQLLSTEGLLLSTEIFRNKSQSFMHQYQTAHLPAGHYYLRIINDKQSVVKNVSIVH